jgi:ribosomal protein S18 acetylase RimI-like enzyme
MNASIEYHLNRASVAEIAEHLTRCDADFVPTLSLRVEINSYAQKLASKAMRFEAWSGGTLVGLVAAYCNDEEKRIAYLTSVSVLRAWTGQGIAARLVAQCVEYAKASGLRQISLEVARDNTRATALYGKTGFVAGKGSAPFINMDLYFETEEQHGQ